MKSNVRAELHQLRLFLAVAQELHFRKAAEQMHIAQPALSQQIKSLETRLGVQLFERHNRRVRLTRAGQVLMEEARHTLAQADHAYEATRAAARGEAGLLRVGFVGSVSYQLLPALVMRIRERAPDLKLHLSQFTTDAQIEALQRGEIDVGIARGDSNRPLPDLHYHALLHEPVSAVLPLNHRLSGARSLALRDLREEAFIFPPRERARRFHDWLLQLCLTAGFSPAIEQRTLQFPALIGLVAAGLGVGLVPQMVRVFRRPDVRLVALADEGAVSTVTAITRSPTADPGVALFLSEASAECRRMMLEED